MHGEVNDSVPWMSRRAIEAHEARTLPKYRRGIKKILLRLRRPGELGSDDDVNLRSGILDLLSFGIPEDVEDSREFESRPKGMKLY